MKKIISFSVLLLAAVGILTACGHSSRKEADSKKVEKIEVVTTFYPIYEFTKAVVGDKGTVSLLIKAGNEPHEYEPSAKDMAKIADADVFVYNSNALEKWAGKLDNVDKKKTKIIEASKGIKLAKSDKNSEEAGELDPHVWLDPIYAKKEVETILANLIKKYPAESSTFTRNASKYEEKLNNLDAEYQSAFKKATQRSFVTQHAAFGYLAKRYNLTQVAISGISPEEEPSASRLAELKQYVKNNHIQLIYFEENASSKVATTLANETGITTAVLNPIEGITTKNIKNGATYLSIMKDNLNSLQQTVK